MSFFQATLNSIARKSGDCSCQVCTHAGCEPFNTHSCSKSFRRITAVKSSLCFVTSINFLIDKTVSYHRH